MPLASQDDVLRVLDLSGTTLDSASQDAVTKYLETAEAWARDFMRDPNYGAGTSVTESHYSVREDAAVPATGTVTAVSIQNTPGGDLTALAAGQWFHDGAMVRLSPDLSVLWDEATDDDIATTTRMPVLLTRVDVTTTMSSNIDPRVRDGVAMAAGALLTRSARLTKGLRGENIGDYSYNIAELLEGDPFFEQAKVLLRRFRKRESLVP